MSSSTNPTRLISIDPAQRRRRRDATAKADDERARWQKKNATVKAMLTTRGLIGLACKKAGVSERTHRQWMARDAEYHERIRDAIALGQDMIEFRLIEKADAGDVTALRTYLSARCKDRGYGVQRSEVSGLDGKPIAVTNSPTLEEVVSSTPEEELKKMVSRVRRHGQPANN